MHCLGTLLLIMAATLHAETPPLEAAAAEYSRMHVERRSAVVIGRFDNPRRQVMDGRTVAELSNLDLNCRSRKACSSSRKVSTAPCAITGERQLHAFRRDDEDKT